MQGWTKFSTLVTKNVPVAAEGIRIFFNQLGVEEGDSTKASFKVVWNQVDTLKSHVVRYKRSGTAWQEDKTIMRTERGGVYF